MKLKHKLLELNKAYEEMRKEAINALEAIKPKVSNITDAQTVQSFIGKKDFYWKHDLKTVRSLAETYGINIYDLEETWKKYIKIEQMLQESKAQFEDLGLKEITFGPKTLLSALGEKQSNIRIYPKGIELDVRVFLDFVEEESPTKDFEEFAERLKEKIKNLTEKDF